MSALSSLLHFSLSYNFLPVWHRFMFSKMSQNTNRKLFFSFTSLCYVCRGLTTTSHFIYECSRSVLENKRLECDFLTCWMFSGKCRSKLKPWQSSDLGSSVGRELLCRGTKAERCRARTGEGNRASERQRVCCGISPGASEWMFMDDSALECSQMESFNWPEAPTGLAIRGGLWWQKAQIYGSLCERCRSNGGVFLQENNSKKRQRHGLILPLNEMSLTAEPLSVSYSRQMTSRFLQLTVMTVVLWKIIEFLVFKETLFCLKIILSPVGSDCVSENTHSTE